jgi:hypothetical protein
MKSYGLGMGEAAVTSGNALKYDTLMSGGAADCVIIAAYNPELRRAYMVHAHRLTDLTIVIDQIETYVRVSTSAPLIQVHLASQVFSTANPNDSALVRLVNSALAAANLVVSATHAVSSLGVNVRGVFSPGIDAATADRAASDASTAGARVDVKLLAPNLAPAAGGRAKSSEAPY